MNADGSSPRQLTTLGASTDPAWSPEGTRIAFAGPGPSACGCQNLWIMNSDGTDAANQENGWWDSGMPAWAPIGAASAPAPAADTVEVTRAEYTSSNGELRIEATSTSATATLTAFVAYSGERIGTLANLGGGKYGGRFTWSVNPSRVTVKSSLGGSATKVQEK